MNPVLLSLSPRPFNGRVRFGRVRIASFERRLMCLPQAWRLRTAVPDSAFFETTSLVFWKAYKSSRRILS